MRIPPAPAATLAAALAAPIPAAALDLAFPVDCTLGRDCYLQNLFDHDPGPGAQDAACGTLAYDGHDGTDIALPTLADLGRGVEVRAVAPGIVVATRDGMPDALQGRPDSPDVAQVECGNGVLLDHGDGWETQYCHMARGSIAVGQGDRVEAGASLGRIGLSGMTEFPHLELIVRRDGAALDPFAPEAPGACGELPARGLWRDPLPFPEGGVTDAGFATDVPEFEAILAGTAEAAPSPEAPLVLFGLLYGGREGDLVRLSFTGPDGAEVFAHEEALERTQALLFRAAGRRAPEGGWPAGTYEGTAVLLRDGREIGSLAASATMP